MKKNDAVWIGLLALIYLLFWVPMLDVYPSLTPGDMGRDLYASQMVLEGRLPFRDYWWQYGPLMPFYYAFWLLVAGVNLVSVKIGVGVVYFLCSFLTYRLLRLFTSAPVAFLSALAFLGFDMTWTFNHIGAIPLLLLSLFSLWKFFLTGQCRWPYLGMLALTAATLVKINTGVAFFGAFLASLFFFNGDALRRHSRPPLAWKHFVFLSVLFLGMIAGIYRFFTEGAPAGWIDQWFPLNPVYRSFLDSPWTNFKHLVLHFLVWQPKRLLGVDLTGFLFLLGWRGLARRSLSSRKREVLAAVAGSLLLFLGASSLDYLTLGALIYRLDFWIFPFLVVALGLCVESAKILLGKTLQKLAAVFFLSFLLWKPSFDLKEALASKTPGRYLDLERGKVYLMGPLSSVETSVETFREGTRFILENSSPDQEILAVPYDPLYCFLAGRRHAPWEVKFIQDSPPSEGREDALIRSLETKQVPLVLMSNRSHSSERGIGYFGKTHCRKLAQFLSDRFEEVKTIGPWQADYPLFHALKVFRRKREIR